MASAKTLVKCAGGLIVQAEHDFQTCPPVKNIIVTGGPGWTCAANDQATLGFLRSRNQSKDTRISVICMGAMILAAAGLLNGKAAATKSEVFDGEVAPIHLLGQGQRTNVRTDAIVEDGGVLTSGGVTLGIDAVFHLLARNHGTKLAEDVARVMEYTRARKANREALGYMAE